MSAIGPGPKSDYLQGDQLLERLGVGWSPMPQKTVMTLVMSGLRVRLMRSVVTMISIVLAIAFLSYTGLSNQLYRRLAEDSQRLEATEQVPTRDAGQALTTLLTPQLLAGWTLEQQRQVGMAIGMAEVSELQVELGKVQERLRAARTQHVATGEALRIARANPQTPSDELEAAQLRQVEAAQRYEELTAQAEQLTRQVDLGRWLRTGRSDRPQVMAQWLGEVLEQRRISLLRGSQGLGRLDANELAALAAFVDQALGTPESGEQNGESRQDSSLTSSAAIASDALQREQSRRAGANLRILLRQQGINITKTLEGDPMDTWLIAMALLTCAVGIANAMLMSVTERIREIGTMKCLGAQDTLVVKLFLLESGVLGVIGALAGIVLGLVVALLGALLQFGNYGLSGFPYTSAWTIILWSVVSGMLLSVIGAVYPALVAARMKPVDALRVDE